MSSWEHVSSKLGDVRPATRSIAKEIYDAAASAGHEIWFMWGMGPSSEHSTGRALDLMVRNKAAGDFIYNYVWQNRARLRLRHIIWWQSITSTTTRPGVRRKMADRGNSTANHKDHPHIFLFDGVYRPPAKSSTPSISDSLRPGEVGHDRNFKTASQIRGRVATMRHNAGLSPDTASDQVWVDRIFRKKTHHLGQARMEIYRKGISSFRRQVGLPKDEESDQVWVDRIVVNRTRTMEDARREITNKASNK